MTSFLDALKKKVLIFDGAMGTSIHSYSLTLDDFAGRENCPEILVETKPEIIQEIHESFFRAGCDVVETDTFGGSPVVLAEFDLADRAYELNLKAAKLAKEVAADYSQNGQRRYVSGSIGPTTKLPSLGHISFADMNRAYYQQVAGLIDGGVDVLQFETGQDLLQAKAAIIAVLDYCKKIGRRVPIIAQVTIEAPPPGDDACRFRYYSRSYDSQLFPSRCCWYQLRDRSTGDVGPCCLSVSQQSEDGFSLTKCRPA